ncbi:MAG: zinc-binding dehydrogenase, partial [Gemmatimonadota bacterium]
LVEAAGVPEVFYTAWDALFRQAGLEMGERVLIHAAGGGVGTAALQLARAAGAERIFGTASAPKLEGIGELCLPLDVPVDYESRDFADAVREETGGEGVEVILDVVGGSYWDRNMESLARQGRMVLVGLLGGRSAEVDLGQMLRNRITVVGTVLRARSLAEKLSLTRAFRQRVLPLFRDGRLRPVIDRTFPLEEAADAHRHMEADRNLGKIVLEVSG